MPRAKIVCTIGPASRDPEILLRLVEAGMNVARLNMSHGNKDFHAQNARRVREAAGRAGRAVALLFDLQGPKLRVGTLPEDGIWLEADSQVRLTTEQVPAGLDLVPVLFDGLPQAVHPGDPLLLDDGLLELQVLETGETEVLCRVITGGLLRSNKGLNLPQADFSIPAITAKDREDLRFALEQGADWIAMSFVRQAEELLDLKAMIRELAPFGRSTPVIAKIEKPQAIKRIDEIIAVADGIMVARGDLGIETAPEAVPMMQKTIITKCNQAGVPVITATQMLDSMIRNPRPTRAEASDVANAILDGTDAIMLSGETAVGKYPVRSVETMVRITDEAERSRTLQPVDPRLDGHCSVTEAVCFAATDMVNLLSASAIVVPTVGGTTARTLARFRPSCAIIATTPNPMVERQLQLHWGIDTVRSRRASNTDTVIENAIRAAQRAGKIHEGQTVLITAGSVTSAPGVTDLIHVHTLARTLVSGIGVGSGRVTGKIRRLEGPLDEGTRVMPDEIIVARRTDRTFVEAVRDAVGLVTTEGDENAHCYLLAVDSGTPAVIGAGEAWETLADGRWVVLDADQGLVLEHLAMPQSDRG